MRINPSVQEQAVAMTEQAFAWTWFTKNVGDYYHESGELMVRQMVEAFCFYHDTHDWLDDDAHWVWNAPFQAEKWVNRTT